MTYTKDNKYNRLIEEQSPYLRQHAENPVNWYPWGKAAFEAAKEQDKPVFLSIGYSTCHWCHVMAHESFEDSTVAGLMNDAFINIKVDREERPDIDDIYMTVCQMMTGSGGWPLTILMTPDKRPFFAATYIPKDTRFNRLGMVDLIPRIKTMWQNDRQRIYASAEKVTEALSKVSDQASQKELTPNALEVAYTQLEERFDSENGGFSTAPKFPSPHNLMYLLRYYKRTGNTQALNMVETTLQNMRLGGIYDHIGFGFHRYSTDEDWLVPHFEKMLYDQAMLSIAYTEIYQVTKKELYARTVREMLTYVQRDMTDSSGGFYSAEDADSEGEEGKFYVWSYEEILNILGEEGGSLFTKIYNVEEDGNYEEESTRRPTGKNILHLSKPIPELADELQLSEQKLSETIERCRKKLYEAREERVHPFKDDKILTDWNGLMIAAFAKAARVLGEPEYTKTAQKAVDFLLNTMRDENGHLMHRYRHGEVGIAGYLDDYSFLLWGLIELYETTFAVEYLQTALECNEILLQHFWDEKNGAFYFTADDAEKIIVRKKEIQDGAMPSGNSVMMLNLLRLGKMTGNSEYEHKANQLANSFSDNIMRYPAAFTLLMSAFEFGVGPSYEIVIAGDPGKDDTQSMLETIQREFMPKKVLLLRPVNGDSPITSIAKFTEPMTAIDSQATAYVCQNYTCKLPTTDRQKMMELLSVTKTD